MANSNVELPELLHFHPRWFIDPVPWWFFKHLEKEQVVQVARIQVEMQRAILTAYGKALDQIHEGLRTGFSPTKG